MDHTSHFLRWTQLGFVAILLMSSWNAAQAADEDSLFNNSQQITSTQLVGAVLARNPDLAAMRAAWNAARARIVQASAPQVLILARKWKYHRHYPGRESGAYVARPRGMRLMPLVRTSAACG